MSSQPGNLAPEDIRDLTPMEIAPVAVRAVMDECADNLRNGGDLATATAPLTSMLLGSRHAARQLVMESHPELREHFDREVGKRRKESSATGGGKGFALDDVAPWPDPVDGAELLDAICKLIERFVVLGEHGATAVALWVLFTYFVGAVRVAPILAIVSPEKRCGKTTLLGLLATLARRAIPASNITPAALFRAIDKWQPTLLIDEADTFLRGSDEMRGILNAGHTRASAYVIRTVGDDHEPRTFSTWGAKAIALIGKLPDTLADRSIAIQLRRRLPDEPVSRLRDAGAAEFDEIRRKCARFAEDHASVVHDTLPAIPGALNDRAADNWEPLLAIAEVAGGGWPERTRSAANSLSGEDIDGDSIRTELLSDIRDILPHVAGNAVATEELIERVCDRKERRWCEFHHGKPITPRQLAGLLKPFNIRPGTRRDGDVTFKGYAKSDFDDAFARYLGFYPSHRHNSITTRVSADPTSVTPSAVLRIADRLKVSTGAGCDGVTDKKGETAGGGEEIWI